MPACACLALIALVTGPNSTQLRLVQLCQLLVLLMPNCTRSLAINKMKLRDIVGSSFFLWGVLKIITSWTI